MPSGRITQFDPTTGEGRIETKTANFPVRAEDIAADARVEKAFVQFDVQRENPEDRAVNVRLREGTRNNPKQRRFGHTGAER